MEKEINYLKQEDFTIKNNTGRKYSSSWYKKFYSLISSPLCHIICLIFMCIIVFSNTLYNSFELDDFHSIVNNPAIRHIHPLWRHFVDPSTVTILPSNITYRPLLPLSLSITYAISGYNVSGYHIFNIIFQCLGGIFLYLFFFEILTFHKAENNISSRFIAFLGSLIFTIHPISGFCVNYICGRDNPMMVVFITISLYIYVKMRKYGETIAGWIGALSFFLMALCCKPMAVIVPFVVWEFEILIAGEKAFSKRTIYRTWSYGLTVIGIYIFVRYFTTVFQSTHGFIGTTLKCRGIYLMTQFKLHLFHYFRNFFWPFEIRGLPSCEVIDSPLDFKMLLGLFIIILSIIIAFRLRRKDPLISFCIFAYWTMFIPSSSVLPVFQYVADRWMYPSLPYISLITAILIIRYIKKPEISIVSAILLIVYFGISSFFMNYHWKNPLSFYTQCAKYGTNEIGYINLGLACMLTDDKEAKFYYEKALKVNPRYYLAYINLGLWYLTHGDKEKALEMMKKGVKYTPRGCEPYPYYWYGRTLEHNGRNREAFYQYKKAIHSSPKNPDLKILYDGALNARDIGKYKEAVEYFERYLKFDPSNKQVKDMLVECQEKLKNSEK
ncbi:MAG TPA: tetratricopeptide repeat protein [Candidatus Eremiobacteraeota bacterium]|nr:MAG: Photosystem I assembly protein Ycf3 [bacterium ADurb.Bin363]HPZ09379.1 tetratricopeptide repeat protein [Candidatus Eremiobacteraeota bacterium]